MNDAKKYRKIAMNGAKEYREIATTFRGIADAADKVADVVEKENSTTEEMEEALKDFMWELTKMQAMS